MHASFAEESSHAKGGAPDDVIASADHALVNMKLPVKAREYRLTAKVALEH